MPFTTNMLINFMHIVYLLTTTCVTGLLSASVSSPTDSQQWTPFNNKDILDLSQLENVVSSMNSQDQTRMANKFTTATNLPPEPVAATRTGLNGLSSSGSATVPVYKTCSLPQSFAVTFDDGPSSYSSDLDKLLEGHGTKGTYFINGNNIGCIFDHADMLLERFNKGHLIGSHTWSHVNLNEATHQQIHDQLARLESAMIMILGVRPLYFRPPFGIYNDLVLQVLGERGYKGMIMWDQDSQDADSSPPDSSEIIKNYGTWPAQTLALNHETQKSTVHEVMPSVIPSLKQNGFNLMTVTISSDNQPLTILLPPQK